MSAADLDALIGSMDEILHGKPRQPSLSTPVISTNTTTITKQTHNTHKYSNQVIPIRSEPSNYITQSNNTQSNDIDSFIQSLDAALETTNNTSAITSRSKRSHTTVSTMVNVKTSESKCGFPAILSNGEQCCSHLICSECDMHVVRIPKYRWKTSVDYLFLRLNCPNVNALKVQLESADGFVAYCCQCKSADCDQRQMRPSQAQCKWICSIA